MAVEAGKQVVSGAPVAPAGGIPGAPANSAVLPVAGTETTAAQRLETFLRSAMTSGKFLPTMDALVTALRGPSGRIVTINMHHLATYARDPEFRALIDKADFWCADGGPLVSALTKAGMAGVERVTGSDLCADLIVPGKVVGLTRIAILGSTTDAVASYTEALARAGRTVVFADQGNRDDWTREAMEQPLRNASPDVVLVAVGSPHGDYVTDRLVQFAPCPVIAIGAGVGMAVGVEKRAPKAVQGAGLEWAWRLASNPSRMWRRYVLEAGPTMLPLRNAVKAVRSE